MRIIQISSAKNFGGGERHLVDLCEGLYCHGDQRRSVEIFVALRAENNWRKKLSFLPKGNVINLPLKNSLDVTSARKLTEFVKAKDIEIIHAHLARDYPIAALAARKTRVKVVLTRHLLFPLNFLHRFVLPKDATFIAVAEGVRHQLLQQKIIMPEQIKLIYNGVNIRHFAEAKKSVGKENLRRQLNLKSDCRLIGIVGEIASHKGQMDFVRAAARVTEYFPEAEFLIVGQDGSANGKQQKSLENLIEELGLQNKIHLLGWTEDVASIFAALDVFVSASLTEPFGLVIVEAMAAGCAIVATATDGAKEIINDEETGKLVSIANPIELSEAIIELLSDENLRQTLGKKAQLNAKEKFSVKIMVAQTEKIYREILSQ
jgi:glycosyltransferase involved in cell wall biosynthesis